MITIIYSEPHEYIRAKSFLTPGINKLCPGLADKLNEDEWSSLIEYAKQDEFKQLTAYLLILNERYMHES